jgi:O-antigen/teichoic acid export membrane protein
VTASAAERAVAAARSNVVMYPLIALAAVVSSIVIARTLPLSQFALYAVALAVRGTAQLLADLGTGAASQRHFAELESLGARAQARGMFGRLAAARAAAAVVLAIAVAVARDPIADALELAPGERDFLAFAVVIGALEIVAGLGYYALSGTFRQARINQVTLAQGVAQPLAVVLAVALDLGLDGVLAAVVLGSAVRATGLTGSAVMWLRTMPDTGAHRPGLARSYADVAAAAVVGKLSTWAHTRQAVTLIVAASTSRPQLAIFSLAYDFAHQVLIAATSPVSGLVLPLFAAERDPERRRAIVSRTTRGLALLVLPVATILVVASPALMPLLFGDDYADAWHYMAIVVPLAAVDLVLTTPATGLMLAHDRLVRAYLRIRAVALAGVLAYPLLGGSDLLIVTAVMMGFRIAAALALHVVVRREAGAAGESAWLVRMTATCLAAASGGAIVVAVASTDVADLVGSSLVAGAAIALLVWAGRLLRRDDAEMLTRVVPPAGRMLRLLIRR